MREKIIGDWGAELDDGEYACVVAALGVLSAKARPAQQRVLSMRLRDGDLSSTLSWAAGNGNLVAWSHPNRRASFWADNLPSAQSLAEAWSQFRSTRYPGLRLTLAASTLTRPLTDVDETDVPALLDLLTHPDARIDAVSVSWPSRRHSGWNWPIRVGLLNDPTSIAVSERINSLYPANRLAKTFPFSRRESHSDIAVLVGSPTEHTEHLNASPYGERTGMVLFFPDFPTTNPGDLDIREKIARSMRASGFCVIRGLVSDPGDFVNQVVFHLSHDLPIDAALCYVTKQHGLPPPLLLADPSYCRRAQLSTVATKMAHSLERAGDVPVTITPGLSRRIGIAEGSVMKARSAGSAMKDEISNFGYAGESHEASDLAEAKSSLDEAIREVNARKGDPRYIQAQLERALEEATVSVRAIQSRIKHRIKVRVGPFEDNWINPTNREPFPDELLPADEDEHRLRIVISEPHHIPRPLVEEVSIRSTGPSGVATFEFTPSLENSVFHARVAIAHRNRILQTAILSTRVLLEPGEQETNTDRFAVDIEAIVRPALNDLSTRSRFDLALAFNHTVEGQPTVLGLAGKQAMLKVMSQDVIDSILAIGHALSDVGNAKTEYEKGLNSTKGVELLQFLATEGRSLYDYLILDQAIPSLGKSHLQNDATHIQIVSLTPDAYFPAEFIYEFGVPGEHATVCPTALKALTSNDYSYICAESDHAESNNKHVCPFGFWGLRRVVERHAFKPIDTTSAAADFVLKTEPGTSRNILEITKTALFAASDNVDKEKAGASLDLFNKISTLFTNNTSLVKKWEEWTDTVSTHEPGLLIALPHVETKFEHTKPYFHLEIGGQLLKANYIDFRYVKKNQDTSPPPIVILLGCDTAVPQTEMDSIVSRFRRAGAAIVVGTVASVLGSHASSVAREIVAQLASIESRKQVPFGDLLLASRRRAIGQGVLMAMCIGGFGDADWLIKN